MVALFSRNARVFQNLIAKALLNLRNNWFLNLQAHVPSGILV